MSVDPARQQVARPRKQLAQLIQGAAGQGVEHQQLVGHVAEHHLAQLAVALEPVPERPRPEEVVEVANGVEVQRGVAAQQRADLRPVVQADDGVGHGSLLSSAIGRTYNS